LSFGYGQHNEMLSTMLTKQDKMKKLIDAMSACMDAFEKSPLSMKQTSSSRIMHLLTLKKAS